MVPAGSDHLQLRRSDAGYPGESHMIATTAGVSGLLAATRNAGVSDAELLGRYVAERDESAFAALVTRHGPMVFGVCRRVVRDWHLAEDAFQATFLVLARRAEMVSQSSTIVGWLHEVAYRVAKSARRTALRRTGRERPAGDMLDPETTPAPDIDLCEVIDGEVRKLPRKYRDLIVACDLEERTRRSVAVALDIPEGTLSSRLTAARKMLAERLARRGVAPASVLLIALGGAGLGACEVPRRMLASAAQLGCGATGTVPVGVLPLASKASQTVTYRILAPVAFLVLTACGVLSAALNESEAPQAAQPPATPSVIAVRSAATKPDPKPVPKGPNKLIFRRNMQDATTPGVLTIVDPDGKNEQALPDGDLEHQPYEMWFSPDGDRLAVINGAIDPETKNLSYRLYVRKTADADTVTDLGVACRIATWSADGTQLACTNWDGLDSTKWVYSSFLVDVETKKKTPLKLPDTHVITDWSRDGKYFLTTSQKWTKESVEMRMHLMNRDGTEHKALTGETQLAGRGKFSPDGKRVLFERVTVPKKDQKKWPPEELAILDLVTGKSTVVEGVPTGETVMSFCWSPNGKQIAYVWMDYAAKRGVVDLKGVTTTIVVCDADGKNSKTVASAKATENTITISGLDWR